MAFYLFDAQNSTAKNCVNRAIRTWHQRDATAEKRISFRKKNDATTLLSRRRKCEVPRSHYAHTADENLVHLHCHRNNG